MLTAGQAAEREGLLADVLAAPDDDGLRLIYADWLEDQGRMSHARFIRAQFAKEAVAIPLSVALPFRDITPGLRNVGEQGVATLASADGSWRITFRRGFVEEISLPLAGWMDHGPALVRAHPLRGVALTDRDCGVPNPTGLIPGKVWWHFALDGAVHGGPSTTHWLPACLNRPSLWPGCDCRPHHVRFDTPGEANAALSAACLAWARSA